VLIRWRSYRHRPGLALDLLFHCRRAGGAVAAARHAGKPQRQRSAKLDISGLLSLIAVAGAGESVYQQRARLGLGSGLSLTMLPVRAAGGAVFIRSGCAKGTRALIDFALFRNRAYSAACLSFCSTAIGTMMITSIWLQRAQYEPAGDRRHDAGLSGDRSGDDPRGKSCCSAMAQAADDDRAAADRRGDCAYLLHLSR
jgi:hypothetical protein